jgi:hypothetical protein
LGLEVVVGSGQVVVVGTDCEDGAPPVLEERVAWRRRRRRRRKKSTSTP